MRAIYFDLIADAKRDGFVENIAAYLEAHDFDGLDVDLEGPAINADYGKFIAALSVRLKADDKLLTAALSQGYGGDKVSDETLLLFDFLNIMAYDATGPWNPGAPGQHSSFAFALSCLDYWSLRGIEKEKAILGVPFYGYGFGIDFNEGISFAAIVDQYEGGAYRDVSGNTIYYNGIPTIRAKTAHVLAEGYGGIMIWNLAQDLETTDPRSLLKAIDDIVHNRVLEAESDIAVAVYPNPAVDILWIETSKALHQRNLFIIDRSGRRLFVNHDEKTVDVSLLSSGMYFLGISDVRGTTFTKFVKQ